MRYAPRVFALPHAPDAGHVLACLSRARGVALLDSAAGDPSGWSVIGFDPLPGREMPRDLVQLRAFTRELERRGGDDPPGPFAGGFIGALAYDLGVHGERAPRAARDRCRDVPAPAHGDGDPWLAPRIVGGLYTDFIVRDEVRGESWLVLGEHEADGRASVAQRREEIRVLLARPIAPPRAHPDGVLVRHTSAREHCARIERARELIAAGEFYQANLAHRFTRRIAGDPIDVYRRLRRVNPAPYMAFVSWDHAPVHGEDGSRFAGASRSFAGAPRSFPDAPRSFADAPRSFASAPRSFADASLSMEGQPSTERRASTGALLSASPELLFEFDGRVARTRPIKGTVPRGKTAAEDERLSRALLSSEKDRAELAMIVDLERNDLGRIARPGSVQVERFAHLESYASVHHLSADVVAHPRDGVDAVDILCALFPGGSITGAPKLASMQAIADLEGEGRGFFTGSAGFIDTRGNACFNILIRTLVWRPIERGDPTTMVNRRTDAEGVQGEISFHVGSGITWSSVAEEEDRETLAKGAALEAALEVAESNAVDEVVEVLDAPRMPARVKHDTSDPHSSDARSNTARSKDAHPKGARSKDARPNDASGSRTGHRS